VHMTLPDDGVVDELIEMVRPHLRKDAVMIDHSTTSPAGTKKRVPRLNGAGVKFIHAPVFMSPQMCRDGVGVMLASGPDAGFDEVRGEVERMSGEVWYLGEEPERAAAYKIFGNSMLFVIVGGITDIFAMAKNLGISPADALAIFSRFQPGGIIKTRGD